MAYGNEPKSSGPWLEFTLVTGIAAALAAILSTWAGAASTAASTATVTVPVPCSPTSTTLGLRSCQLYLAGQAALPPTATFVGAPAQPGMLGILAQRIQNQSSCYYQGIDFDPSQVTASTGTQCVGNVFGHPCDLTGSSLAGGVQETTVDHLGKACGDFMGINVQITTCGNNPPDVMAVLAAPPYNITPAALEAMSASALQALYTQLQTTNPALVAKYPGGGGKNICLFFNPNPPYGERERGYMRGALIQSLSNAMAKVENEINCKQTITIAPGIDGTNHCAAFGSDVQKLSLDVQTTLNSLKAAIGNQKGVNDVPFCEADWAPPVPAGSAVDVGQLRQQAQHLCAARSNLEAAFTQLALCDVLSQAQASYISNIGFPALQASFLTQATKDLDPPCRKQCAGVNSMPDLNTCVNQCYQTLMPNYMRGKFSAMYPPAPALNSCGTNQSPVITTPTLPPSTGGNSSG